MKKTYINPELEVVKIQTMQMLASSSIDIDPDPIDPGDIGGHGTDFDFGAEEEFVIEEEEFDFE